MALIRWRVGAFPTKSDKLSPILPILLANARHLGNKMAYWNNMGGCLGGMG